MDPADVAYFRAQHPYHLSQTRRISIFGQVIRLSHHQVELVRIFKRFYRSTVPEIRTYTRRQCYRVWGKTPQYLILDLLPNFGYEETEEFAAWLEWLRVQVNSRFFGIPNAANIFAE